MNPFVHITGALTFGSCKPDVRKHIRVHDWVLCWFEKKLVCVFRVQRKIRYDVYMSNNAAADALYEYRDGTYIRKKNGLFAGIHISDEDRRKDVNGEFVLVSRFFAINPCGFNCKTGIDALCHPFVGKKVAVATTAGIAFLRNLVTASHTYDRGLAQHIITQTTPITNTSIAQRRGF